VLGLLGKSEGYPVRRFRSYPYIESVHCIWSNEYTCMFQVLSQNLVVYIYPIFSFPPFSSGVEDVGYKPTQGDNSVLWRFKMMTMIATEDEGAAEFGCW
jgi:hypothetical protein